MSWKYKREPPVRVSIRAVRRLSRAYTLASSQAGQGISSKVTWVLGLTSSTQSAHAGGAERYNLKQASGANQFLVDPNKIATCKGLLHFEAEEKW